MTPMMFSPKDVWNVGVSEREKKVLFTPVKWYILLKARTGDVHFRPASPTTDANIDHMVTNVRRNIKTALCVKATRGKTFIEIYLRYVFVLYAAATKNSYNVDRASQSASETLLTCASHQHKQDCVDSCCFYSNDLQWHEVKWHSVKSRAWSWEALSLTVKEELLAVPRAVLFKRSFKLGLNQKNKTKLANSDENLFCQSWQCTGLTEKSVTDMK